MRYEKGLSYKFTSLNEEKRLKILHFLNNQSNATDAIHTLILNHIAAHGDGDIKDLQIIQPAIQNLPVQQVHVETPKEKAVQTSTNNFPEVEQTVETKKQTNNEPTDKPKIELF